MTRSDVDEHATMMAKQRSHLIAVTSWARRIRAELHLLLDEQRHPVHFRPSSGGVAMVGLAPGRAQRGKTSIRDLSRVAADFDARFRRHCLDVDQGRPTPEKELQSFLIREAYANERRLWPLTAAAARSASPVELSFVTDEIALPVDGGARIVCDLLALRTDAGRAVPVAIELKSSRHMKRLVEQVTGYAALIDQHADLFSDLFGALLGVDVRFTGPCEKWIVWPAAGDTADPREDELGRAGMRVVGYVEDGERFAFRAGEAPTR